MSTKINERKMDIRTVLQEASSASHNISFRDHFHNSYELIFVRSGMKKLDVAGKEYLLPPGSLAIISCLESHSTYVLSEECNASFFLIYPEYLDTVIPNASLCSIFRNHTASFSHVVDMSDSFDLMDRCFDAIVSEYQNPGEYSHLLLSSYVSEILISIFRKYPDRFTSLSGSVAKVVFTVQKYLEENYGEELRITDIAKTNFINPYYLSRCFKEQTGYSPKQYLTNIRLAHSKELLIHTSISIKEVAYQSGFTDVNNFIRIFKSYTGTTPFKYRYEK